MDRGRVATAADFHLGHNKILRYCNRPFQSVEEMDQAILERLNASVSGEKIEALTNEANLLVPNECQRFFVVRGNVNPFGRRMASGGCVGLVPTSCSGRLLRRLE